MPQLRKRDGGVKPHHVQIQKKADGFTEITVDGFPVTVDWDGLLYEQRFDEVPTVTLRLLVDGPISEKIIKSHKDGTRVEIVQPYTGGFDF